MIDLGTEGWIKSLTTYGPAAAALLVLIVGLKSSWSALQKAEGKMRGWMLAVYLANWGVFFVLLGLTVYSWFFFYLRREYTIAGTIERVPEFDDRSSNAVSESLATRLSEKVAGAAKALRMEQSRRPSGFAGIKDCDVLVRRCEHSPCTHVSVCFIESPDLMSQSFEADRTFNRVFRASFEG